MKDRWTMHRLLGSLLATGLLLTTACESEPAKPDKTAKADAKKDDAKADAKADDGKADDGKAGDAKGDDAKADDAKADDAKDDEPTAEGDEAAAAEEPAADEAGDDDLDGYDPRVAQAARVATKISEDPQKADDVLAAADLDRDKLDDLMYEIANDPDLRSQYRMARGI